MFNCSVFGMNTSAAGSLYYILFCFVSCAMCGHVVRYVQSSCPVASAAALCETCCHVFVLFFGLLFARPETTDVD